MNLERTRQILKKVNALVENMDEQGQTSIIERDLLLRYLTDLYEQVALPAVLSESTERPVPVENGTIETPIQKTSETTPPVDDQTTYYDAEEESVPLASNSEKEISSGSSKSEKYFPPSDIAPLTSRDTEPVEVLNEEEQDLDDDLFAAVFSPKSSNDLADKLQLQRISDIDRAMGINQRMLTINELFGGDSRLFSDITAQLHASSSFEEAQRILVAGPARQFNWDDKSKEKTAQDFVRFVRRLYV